MLAVLAGTEHVALAASRLTGGSASDAPDQLWGTADGRGHAASAETTDAAAKGGNDGPLKGRGELPVAGGAGATELGATPKPPEPGPVKQVAAPDAPAADGFDVEDSKEVKDKRKERERTFLNEDGTYTTRFYSEPVNFRAEDGSWKDIDTTLVPQEESGPKTMSAEEGDWETNSTETPIEFAGSADGDPLVRMQVGDGLSIGYAVDGASAAAGQADGSVITYPDVRRDADLELISGSDSVKETLVLKDADAPTTWRFPLELRGLTAQIDEHGSVVFADANGNRRAWMPAGWMQDSNLAEDANEGAISSGVTFGLDEASGRQVLVVKLDEEWLSAPERVFPVRVDPSVKSFDSTSGTYVQSPYNQNFSSDTVLKVGTYDGGSHKAAAFLRFTGVESTLKNAWVLNTNLALYNTWSQSCTARPVTIHPITSNWSESTTTKYPGPSTGSSLASKSFAHGWRPSGTETWSCGPAWESIKLGSAGRKLVNDWTHARKKNYGLAVKASTSDSKGWKQFGSDDYPNGKPSLDVTWTKYGATYTMGDFTAPVTATSQGVQKLTIKNQGQETWPKGGDYKLRYNLYDSKGKEIEDSDKIAYTEMPEAVSPGESVTVDAKIAPLAPATYTLQWTMTDYGVSRFTTAGVPGPAIKFSAVNLPPQLTAESPGSGAVVDTLTPTLWAKGKDIDGYPKATLHYTFEVCEVEGSDLRKNCKKGTRSDETQWTVPSGWLSWGKTYAWYAYAYDGDETSARPGAALISTEVSQPTVTSHLGGADSGKEIGTRAGNYVTAATDAAITTVGPELAVTRTYNSLDPRSDGAFGSGWSTRWDMRLRQEAETGMVLVTLADGSQVRFGKNADGTYAGPAGGALTLQNQGGAWQLRERSGSVYHFMAGGVLSRIVDSAGRGQKVQHLTETGGPVTKVTDELSGRSLSFTWSGNHVDTVTTSGVGPDAPGLTWSYSYDGDRLTKVCPPSSSTKCTQYAYDTGSVYRSGVLDASPTSYWRLGESEGATAASDAPSRTGLNDATHRDVTLGGASAIAGTTDTSGGFDGVDSVVELPSDTLQSTAYPTIELWFKTTKATAVLVGFQDEQLGDKPSSYRPVLNIDEAGKLRGEFRRVGVTGATGPITSTAAVTDGVWHHAVLTASATGQTLYLDGKKAGSIAGAVADQSRDYAYLGAGYASDSWMGVATGEYRFAGQMDEVALYSHPLNAATVAEHYAARTAVGQISKVTLPSGRVHATAVYDSGSGRLKEHRDANGGTWTVSAPSYSNASSSYAQMIQGGGATGYWRLGERSGAEAASPLGEELNGSYLDGARPGSPGIFTSGDDTSAEFDGSGAVEVPTESLGTGTEMAVELWFRTTEPGVLATMQNAEFGETPTGWRPMLVIDADGKLRGKFSPDATSILSRSVVTDGKWHHVVLTGNSGAQALYIDGVTQGHNQTGVPTVRHPHVLIGGGYASTSWDGQAGGYRNFTGQIDEVAFYDKTIIPFTQVGSTWLPVWGRSSTPAAHFQARKDLTSGSDAQYRNVAVADTPAAYWRLGEESGTALRSELGGSDATATFRPDTDAADTGLDADGIFGPSGSSALGAGGTTYTELPGSLLAGSTELAVELWFNTSLPTGVLLGFQDAPIDQVPGSFRPVLNIDEAGKLRGEFRRAGVTGATGPITTTQAVTDGSWHHVVLSADATAQTMYLDGVKVGSITGAVSDQSRPYAYLGAGYASESWMGVDPDPYYYQGTLDEVALYRHPLTAEQVSAHYRAQAEPADSTLTSTVKVTDPKQKTSSATYDALRGQRVLSRTDAAGAVTGYAYDTGGNLHTVTDPNGHATITGHDKRGNTVSTTTCRDADSCWTSFTSYHVNEADPLDLRNDKPLTVRDQRSKDHKDDRYRTSFTYNSLGLPTSTVRADSSTSTTTYTAGTETAVGGGTAPAGLLSTQTTPGGSVTANHYYANGDLAEVTSPSGLVTKYTYDGLGRKLSETQVSDTYPNGVATTYAYDKASHVVTETGAGVKNEITGTTHTAQIKRAYDEDGKLLSETVKDTTGGDTERVTAYHYDEYGLNDSVTDAELNTTRFEHDELGRVDSMIDPAGSHYTYTYTANGLHAETVLDDWRGDPSGTLRDLVVVSNAYDPAGRLASTTDAMGATTAYTYFDDGLAATTTAKQVTQSDGSKRDIVLESNTYDAAGHLTKQITGGGKTTQTFTVDALGRTERSVLDPGGLDRVTTLAYDGDDRVEQQTQTIAGDKKLTTTSEYDPAGNVKKRTVTDGASTHITTHTYDRRGLQLTSVSPRGNASGATASAFTTTYRYDELGRLVQETAPQVQAEENGAAATAVQPVTRTGYNTFGDATEVKDARGQITSSEVDQLGRTAAVTLPGYTPPGGTELTATTRTTYNTLGLQESVTDALGRVTSYDYDQFGRVISKTDPPANALTALLEGGSSEIQVGPTTAANGGGITAYTWTPTGLQLSATDATGARTEATYDELGRQLTATTVERYPTTQNLTTRYTWDDAGNQTASRTPAGRITSAIYNPAAEVTSVSDSAGTTRYGYDGLGRQTELVDATDRKTSTTYNALGAVTATTDYGAGSTALRTVGQEYDADGNRTAVVSAEKQTRTTYTYDALGRMTKQVEPVTSTKSITTAFGYDAAGNRTRLTDGRTNATIYTFNSWGLPESTIEPATTATPDVSDRTWTTVYDKAGQPVTELLPGGVQRERTYDGLGRLTAETGSGAEAATTARTLEYDLAGRLTVVGAAGGATQNTYTYNDRGQLLTAAGAGGAAGYAYDGDGNMTYRETEAGNTDYGYDSAGRLDRAWDSITGNDIWYDFDAAGRPKLERYTVKPAGSTTWTESTRRTYDYDDLGRLSSDKVTLPDGTGSIASTDYTYDLDNRLKTKETTGTAGAADNSYGYDDAGRLTSWANGTTTTSYEWDDSGNRTKAGSASATFDARNRQLTDGAKTFTYTPRGTLASVNNGSGTTRTLTSDAFERKITDSGVTYSYDSLDRVQTRGTTTFAYDGGSNNLATDGTSKYNRTPAGSPLSTSTGTTKQWALTDQHTDLVAGLTPDGTAVNGSTAYDPFGTETATNGTTPAVGYQSGYTDPTSADVNMAARWYQPGTGSFGSRDTWQLDPTPSVQANRYGYANGTPLNATDPTGHFPVCWTITGAVACGTILGINAAVGYALTNWLSSSGGGSWGGLGHDYSGSLADSLRNQSRNFSGQQPAARSALVYTGYGSGGGTTGPATRNTCNGYCTTQPTKPPKPPIDQNPNNGSNPVTAPTRPPVAPIWFSGAWSVASGAGVAATITAQAMVDLAAIALFTPDTLPVPIDNPGGKNDGRTRGDERCDVGPGVSPTGHAVYLPRERYYDTFEGRYECRATGVYGLLDSSDYNKGRKAPGTNTNDSTQPPGMNEIRSQGHVPANGHLIPAAASGSGIDLRNLVAEYEKTNHSYISYGVEADIRKSMKSGKHLAISVTPHYGNSGSGIPTEIEYNYGTVEDGNMKHCVITQSPTGGTTRGSADCPRR
ncbi:LamG-like jellyroll fold domain-containing protein [Streptomyces sp. DSM 40750]|uniref:LamG-like jellyroll fold domain-containing protein n=1 Tax=Streptomyces sp. DSM 40750 TaxID=2801030 RepID=UPI00214C59D4|nr:LamG-like jellyroll fold domain-containing protein [Streptomyces sp. DSM 40750]UUU25524.1 DNRLRE domain-containing protein [Streptomyces sp. DSM 40750]